MDYKRIDDQEIEIVPGNIPIDDVILAIAKESYKTAVPMGVGFDEPWLTGPENEDFSECIRPKGTVVGCSDRTLLLDMDYVNGRQCKTYIVEKDGKYILDAWSFEKARGPVERLLDTVKAGLEKKL